MNFNKLRSISSWGILVAIVSFASCTDKSLDDFGSNLNEQTFNTFDFSTTKDEISINVSYAGCGIEVPVFFEIYDEDPVVWNETGSGHKLKEDVKPIFSSYTNEKCVYSGTISLPAYINKVWVYSPSFFAKTVMEADIVDNHYCPLKSINNSLKHA